MSVRAGNLPPGLKSGLPKTLTPEKADYVVFDTKTFESASAHLALVEAYTRALGTETIAIELADLPKGLKTSAKSFAKKGQILGQAVIDALEDPSKLTKPKQKALIQLAQLLHKEMAAAEAKKGTHSKALPKGRLDENQLSKMFAAGVVDIRNKKKGEVITKAGADKLIKLTKRVMLNRGGGLIVRTFFDRAVSDLEEEPSLSDDAVKRLEKFRVQTQPGRTSHDRTKSGALISIDGTRRKKAELKLLNKTQKKALEGVSKRQKAANTAARKNVLKEIKAWGYTKKDLDALVLYVQRYAPLTIQFNPDKKLPGGETVIDSFLGDAFYKNQFQTKISGGSLGPKAGSCRDGWEKEIFDGAYHDHPLIPEERPKYGGLSPLNNPEGNGGTWYGKCFFELRHDVKFRTTFTPDNSSCCDKTQTSSLDTVELLLEQIYDEDPDYLRNMFRVAKGQKTSIQEDISTGYIEAQIHGDLDLARDVEFLVIHTHVKGTPYEVKLKKLADKIGATIKYSDGSKFHL